jgi:5'-3' exonuclease
MDCNSIIYDCLRDLEKKAELKPLLEDNYHLISHAVCVRIEQYINEVGPSDTVYAAFDGIAPLGKMQQQQSRRYKSALMEKIFGKPVFSTLQITPGTGFMKYLSKYVNDYFKSHLKVIVSAADERGEGEHKIFQYIRDHPEKHRTSNTIIYGLDADLLMLSIFHSNKANLFVYREAPEFAKSLNADLNAGEAYILNIAELCVSICIDMGFGNDMANLHRRIHDYAVLCFLMGNDFLPKIPSLNIRTNGLQMIMSAYSENASKKGFYIIDENEKINWKNFDKILEYLEKREEANLIEEARRRRNYKPRAITDREKIEEIVRVLVEREEYVGVLEGGKRERERLMNEEREIDKEIERVYEYYKYGLEIGKGVKGKRSVRSMRENLSKELSSNRSKNPLKDPSKEHSSDPYKEHSSDPFKEHSSEPSSKDFTEEDQLKYIMPIEILKEMGIEKEWDEEVSYEWAYCDYFWEADVIVTRIPLNKKS